MTARGRFPRLPLVALLALVAAAMALGTLFGAQLNRLFLALPGIDKALHIGFHALVFVLVSRVAVARGVPPRAAGLAAAVFGVALSLVDELLQGMTYTRTIEGEDLLAGWTGIILAWVATTRPRRPLAVAVAVVAALVGATLIHRTHVRLRDYSIGARFERDHDFARAREYYLRALASGLRTPALLNALGWAEIESGHGDAPAAVRWAGEALRMQPRNPDVIDTYGWALHHAGRSSEALPLLLDAYRMSPSMYCIHYHLGAVYQALGRPAEARAHYRRQLDFTDTREAAMARNALTALDAAGL